MDRPPVRVPPNDLLRDRQSTGESMKNPTTRMPRATVIVTLMCCACVTLLAAAGPAVAEQTRADASAPAQEYLLAPGDVLSVKFLHNPELNEQVPIRPDGRLALPIVGDVVAAGQSAAQLRGQLIELYSKVVRHPELVVMVQSFGTQRVYVGGQVGRPGELAFIPGMTAMQAVIMAGGDRQTASRSNVVIVRDQGTETPLLLLVDLERVVSKSSPGGDLRLQPRDIVFVPMSKIAKVNSFVTQYIKDVVPISMVMGLYYNFGSFVQH
jgi:polysaccharide biosynthesis/export protein